MYKLWGLFGILMLLTGTAALACGDGETSPLVCLAPTNTKSIVVPEAPPIACTRKYVLDTGKIYDVNGWIGQIKETGYLIDRIRGYLRIFTITDSAQKMIWVTLPINGNLNQVVTEKLNTGCTATKNKKFRARVL